MTKEEYNQIYDDMEEELLKHGDVELIKIIWNGEEMVGAEVGSVFVMYPSEREATLAMRELKGRVYDGCIIKVIYVSRDVFDNDLRLGK